MQAPVLIKPIPDQVVNERAAYGPFDLKGFIQVPGGGEGNLRFRGELKSGEALPRGLICTADGIVTGIPGKDTSGNYDILITAENEAGSLEAHYFMMIKPSLFAADADYIDKLKAQVWQALEQHLPLPDISEMYNQPISILEVYYLLERWGTLKIWDAFNLEPPGEKVLLTLEGTSPHYNVYDRGSCIIAAPKDLFSHERTIEDGLKTARAVAREVYKRNWTIELVGISPLTRAAWVELQHLSDQYGKSLEIINYNPGPIDLKVYQTEALHVGMRSGLE